MKAAVVGAEQSHFQDRYFAEGRVGEHLAFQEFRWTGTQLVGVTLGEGSKAGRDLFSLRGFLGPWGKECRGFGFDSTKSFLVALHQFIVGPGGSL